MIKHALPLAILVLLGASSAQAQVRLQVEIGLPVAPPLVMIQPGIQVVEGFREEVFFHRGWYWCRRPDGWYRARSPQARFEWIEARHVPMALVQVPVGRYRNWRHDARPEEHRRVVEHERRDERRDDRHDRHERDRN